MKSCLCGGCCIKLHKFFSPANASSLGWCTQDVGSFVREGGFVSCYFQGDQSEVSTSIPLYPAIDTSTHAWWSELGTARALPQGHRWHEATAAAPMPARALGMLLALHVCAIGKCRAWAASMATQSWNWFKRVETNDWVHLHSPFSPDQEYALETIILIVCTYHTDLHQRGVLGHTCETRPMPLANITLNPCSVAKRRPGLYSQLLS